MIDLVRSLQFRVISWPGFGTKVAAAAAADRSYSDQEVRE